MADSTTTPALPCLVCDKPLVSVRSTPIQPSGGVACSTYGGYGSTVFDSFLGESLLFNVCDTCLLAKQASVYYREGEEPVRPKAAPWRPSVMGA